MLERTARERDLLERAKARLDRLDFYPRPVAIEHVRIVSAPWLFRLPWFKRFDGYDVGPLILLRASLEDAREDLVTHELCHAWQAQHRLVRMWLSYLWQGYARNTHEIEARRAVELTRART